MKHPWQKMHRWWLEKRNHDFTVIVGDKVFHHWACWCRVEKENTK